MTECFKENASYSCVRIRAHVEFLVGVHLIFKQRSQVIFQSSAILSSGENAAHSAALFQFPSFMLLYILLLYM